MGTYLFRGAANIRRWQNSQSLCINRHPN